MKRVLHSRIKKLWCMIVGHDMNIGMGRNSRWMVCRFCGELLKVPNKDS